MMNTTESAIKSRLHRARKKLAEILAIAEDLMSKAMTG